MYAKRGQVKILKGSCGRWHLRHRAICQVVSILYKANGQTADWINFALTAKLTGIHASLWSLLMATSILSRMKPRDTLLLYQTTSPRSLTTDLTWGSDSLPGIPIVLNKSLWVFCLTSASFWNDQWWVSWNRLIEEFSDRPSHALFVPWLSSSKCRRMQRVWHVHFWGKHETDKKWPTPQGH